MESGEWGLLGGRRPDQIEWCNCERTLHLFYILNSFNIFIILLESILKTPPSLETVFTMYNKYTPFPPVVSIL